MTGWIKQNIHLSLIHILHGGVGAINESDVTLAATSNAIIIGFNVRPDAMAKQMAEREKVDMRLYRVIYQDVYKRQKEDFCRGLKVPPESVSYVRSGFADSVSSA